MSFLRRARLAIERGLPGPLPPTDIESRPTQGSIVSPHITFTSVDLLAVALTQPGGPSYIVLDPRVRSMPAETVLESVTRVWGNEEAVHRWGDEQTSNRTAWIRLRVPSSTTLDSAIVPRRLADAEYVMVVSQPHSADGVVGMWRNIVHPHSAMRSRLAGNGAEADLALAISASYVIILDHVHQGAIALANGPLGAELVALAAWRLIERRRGIEAEGPWEDARVQRLTEATIGAGVPPTLSLDIVLPDNATRSWSTALASELGYRTGQDDTTANVVGSRKG